jgi:hypothetical protein
MQPSPPGNVRRATSSMPRFRCHRNGACCRANEPLRPIGERQGRSQLGHITFFSEKKEHTKNYRSYGIILAGPPYEKFLDPPLPNAWALWRERDARTFVPSSAIHKCVSAVFSPLSLLCSPRKVLRHVQDSYIEILAMATRYDG